MLILNKVDASPYWADRIHIRNAEPRATHSSLIYVAVTQPLVPHFTLIDSIFSEQRHYFYELGRGYGLKRSTEETTGRLPEFPNA